MQYFYYDSVLGTDVVCTISDKHQTLVEEIRLFTDCFKYIIVYVCACVCVCMCV